MQLQNILCIIRDLGSQCKTSSSHQLFTNDYEEVIYSGALDKAFKKKKKKDIKDKEKVIKKTRLMGVIFIMTHFLIYCKCILCDMDAGRVMIFTFQVQTTLIA